MADVTQVAANVRLVSEESTENKVEYGEASISPGDWLYQAADRTYKKAQNDGTELEATVKGMALMYGGVGDQGYIAGEGAEVDVGATLTQGQAQYLSHNLGKMCPEGDVSTGRRVTGLGVGMANGNMTIELNPTGVTKP